MNVPALLQPAWLALAGMMSAPPRREAVELMDEPVLDPVELAVNLRDIRRVNRLGGGTAAVLAALPALLAEVPPDREATVLDLGTGSGDIPLAIARWSRRRGRPIRVVASDVSDEILAAATPIVADEPRIELARHDARAVRLPDRSFDVVLCSMTLHHFPPHDAVAVLREMHRLARHGFVLNDLARSRRGYAGALLSSRIATRNRMTRHDAPLSVLRAYTPDELRDLLMRAGIEGAVVRRRPLFRMTAVKQQHCGQRHADPSPGTITSIDPPLPGPTAGSALNAQGRPW
ncbi:MAG: methyltransferase domain-containing protein [Chloroflexota bacterium]|nr:methyltransferase domain-containing protein [Chloroflexota bacterium]